MVYFVDTNVLLRFADRSHDAHSTTRNAVRTLRLNGHRLCCIPQNCVEFWNVATRPVDKNGFGLTPEKANHLLHLVERLFSVLPDSPAIYRNGVGLLLPSEFLAFKYMMLVSLPP